MTVEFHKQPTTTTRKRLFGLLPPQEVVGEKPDPVIAKPEENSTTNETVFPSRRLKVKDGSENHLRTMVVTTQDSVEITDYEIIPGQQPKKIGESITLVEDAINWENLVTTEGEDVLWRKTKPGEPEFTSTLP